MMSPPGSVHGDLSHASIQACGGPENGDLPHADIQACGGPENIVSLPAK